MARTEKKKLKEKESQRRVSKKFKRNIAQGNKTEKKGKIGALTPSEKTNRSLGRWRLKAEKGSQQGKGGEGESSFKIKKGKGGPPMVCLLCRNAHKSQREVLSNFIMGSRKWGKGSAANAVIRRREPLSRVEKRTMPKAEGPRGIRLTATSCGGKPRTASLPNFQCRPTKSEKIFVGSRKRLSGYGVKDLLVDTDRRRNRDDLRPPTKKGSVSAAPQRAKKVIQKFCGGLLPPDVDHQGGGAWKTNRVLGARDSSACTGTKAKGKYDKASCNFN